MTPRSVLEMSFLPDADSTSVSNKTIGALKRNGTSGNTTMLRETLGASFVLHANLAPLKVAFSLNLQTWPPIFKVFLAYFEHGPPKFLPCEFGPPRLAHPVFVFNYGPGAWEVYGVGPNFWLRKPLAPCR